MFRTKIEHTEALPITLADAKAWCRVDYDTDDTLLTDLISEKVQWSEQYTGRTIVVSDVAVEVSQVSQFFIPFYNTQSAIVVKDVDGTAIESYTLTGNLLQLPSDDYYIITFSTLADLPDGLKTGILKVIHNAYDNRGSMEYDLTRDYDSLRQYRITPIF